MMLKQIFHLHLVLLAGSLIPAIALRGLQNGNGNTQGEVLICDILIAHILPLNEEEQLQNDANANPDANQITNADDYEMITCIVDDIVYAIPQDVINLHQDQLNSPGRKTMYIEGGSLPLQATRRTFVEAHGASDEIVIPPGAAISFINNNANGRRKLEGEGMQRQQGTSSVLVIRVNANDASTTMSVEQLYDRIFGDGSKVIQDRNPDVPSGTLTKTYQDCSMGKMNFVPATGYDIESGVGVVDIDMDAVGANNREVENAVTRAINEKYGSVNDWDHIMYCLPKGTDTGWVAYGYTDFYRSVYNDVFCGTNSMMVHEVGHNIGLQYVSKDVHVQWVGLTQKSHISLAFSHSNEAGKYKDQSCMLGFSYKMIGGPRMCFNAHKNWVLGWYSDRQIQINPDNGPWAGRLLAFTDYPAAVDDEVVLLHFSDVYIQYNRAKGINQQVMEKRNEVIVTQAQGEKFTSESLRGLKEGNTFEYKKYTIEFCSQTTDADGRDYAVVGVSLTTEGSACDGFISAPTDSLAAPTPVPTTTQTLPPIPLPTTPQTLTPTPLHTTPQTLTPTPLPTPPQTLPLTPLHTPTQPLPPSVHNPTQKLPPTPPVPTPAPTNDSNTGEPTAPSTLPSLSSLPSQNPSIIPSSSLIPSVGASDTPSIVPFSTLIPSVGAPDTPSIVPSVGASDTPSIVPSVGASDTPSIVPSSSLIPSVAASETPSIVPSVGAPDTPSIVPSSSLIPSVAASETPSIVPSSSLIPSVAASETPSIVPSSTLIPSVGASESPSKAPGYDGCDDSRDGEFWVPFLELNQKCVWLKDRPNVASLLCEEEQENDARSVCPETCGACTDTCVDDLAGMFLVDEIARDCEWLDLRPHLLEQECQFGKGAWNYCRETCGNCNPFPTAVPSSTPSGTYGPTITASPTAKNPYDSCDDDRFGTFYANETDKEEPCRWLWNRPDMILVYCNSSHPDGAFDLCEETCGKCSDTCEDDNDIRFKVPDKNGTKDCAYIAVRNNLIDELCVEGEVAYEACRETCDSCLPP